MFSTLAKSVLTKNLVRNSSRNLYWVKETNGFKYIGLNKDAISIFEGIGNVIFPNNKIIKIGETLFEVDSYTNLNKEFKSKENTIIFEKNKNVMKTLNKYPEDTEKSWILKVKHFDTMSFSYGKFLQENPNATKEERKDAIKKYYEGNYTPYTYNTSPNDYKKNTNKFDSYSHSNANENDLICYIMGNH